MNPYFLLLYMVSLFYKYFNIGNAIHYGMLFIQNVKLIGSLCMPEPKGTVERKRGFLKISYYMEEGDGMKKRYVLLPFKGLPKKWTKVEAILESDYRNRQDKIIDSVPTDASSAYEKEETIQSKIKDNKEVIDSDLNDITKDLDELSKSSSDKLYPGYFKVNVTKDILNLAGPGKDFFGIGLTPVNLSSEYHALIFHYPKATKLFEADQIITF